MAVRMSRQLLEKWDSTTCNTEIEFVDPKPNKASSGYIYIPTSTPCDSNPLGTTTGNVTASQTRTFTLGLVRAEGPPDVALLAHASVMLGATAAELGRAVRTLAHVC